MTGRAYKLAFVIGVLALLSPAPSSLAQEKNAEAQTAEVAAADNQVENVDFYDNVQSIEELNDEVDDTVASEENVVNEIKDEKGVVYKMPESCREFSTFLQRKQDKLIERENEIERREKLLVKMQAEFETLIARYSSVEKQIKDLVQRDPSNLKDNPELAKMIKLYEGLAPEEAAARLRNLDLDFTLALLRGMNPKKLGQIMAALEPKLAAALSSQIVRGF